MNAERLAQLLNERLGLAKVAAVVLWATWLVSLVIGGGMYPNDKLVGIDHLAFYSAARLVTEGQGARAYDYNYLAAYQTELGSRGYLDAYRNPPFYALLYVPTARLPYAVSFWTWTAVSLLALWFGLRWLGSSRPAAAFVWAMAFYPVFATVSFGQNSLLSFAVFALTFHLLERNRPFAAGLSAGLLLYKPQLLLCLGFWWLLDLRHYWQALVGLTVTGLALLAVSVVVLSEETQEFVRRFREIARYDAFYFYNLHTPRGFWTLLFGDDKRLGDILGAVSSVIAAGAFVLFWWHYRAERALVFAGAVFVTLWASPHTMIYDWSLALVPAMILWERRPTLRTHWLPLLAAGWAVLFISTPLSQGQFEWLGGAFQVSVPVLAVLGLLAERILRRATPSAPSGFTLPRANPSEAVPEGT